MIANKDARGFIRIDHERYASDPPGTGRFVGESSIIGDYDDAFERPGSSALWFGIDFHLDREEVADLIRRLQHWLDHKRLPLD